MLTLLPHTPALSPSRDPKPPNRRLALANLDRRDLARATRRETRAAQGRPGTYASRKATPLTSAPSRAPLQCPRKSCGIFMELYMHLITFSFVYLPCNSPPPLRTHPICRIWLAVHGLISSPRPSALTRLPICALPTLVFTCHHPRHRSLGASQRPRLISYGPVGATITDMLTLPHYPPVPLSSNVRALLTVPYLFLHQPPSPPQS